MDLNELRNLAETTDVFSEELFNTLQEFIDYNSTGMRVSVTEALQIIKNRIENGDEIVWFKTNVVLDIDNYEKIVLNTFGEQIYEDVFDVEIE